MRVAGVEVTRLPKSKRRIITLINAYLNKDNSLQLETDCSDLADFILELTGETLMVINRSDGTQDKMDIYWCAEFLKPMFQIAFKLAGYKADVTERRVIIAGRRDPGAIQLPAKLTDIAAWRQGHTNGVANTDKPTT